MKEIHTSLKPIIVTGAHRTGTTWMGRILGQDASTVYLSEPFNVEHNPGLFEADIPYYFLYIHEKNEQQYLAQFQNLLSLKAPTTSALFRVNELRQALEVVMHTVRLRQQRKRQGRPLIKDPYALFSAEWLFERFDADLVVMIRHPAAFARSLIRLGWHHPFEHFLAQPLLMQRFLGEFEDEIRFFAKRPQPIIAEASLLWRIIYSRVIRYRKDHRDWLFIRHEDLASNPVSGFGKIFEALDLDYSNDIRQAVNPDNTSAGSSRWSIQSSSLKPVMKDSAAVAAAWRHELDKVDIERLKREVQSVASAFYGEGEW